MHGTAAYARRSLTPLATAALHSITLPAVEDILRAPTRHRHDHVRMAAAAFRPIISTLRLPAPDPNPILYREVDSHQYKIYFWYWLVIFLNEFFYKPCIIFVCTTPVGIW